MIESIRVRSSITEHLSASGSNWRYYYCAREECGVCRRSAAPVFRCVGATTVFRDVIHPTTVVHRGVTCSFRRSQRFNTAHRCSGWTQSRPLRLVLLIGAFSPSPLVRAYNTTVSQYVHAETDGRWNAAVLPNTTACCSTCASLKRRCGQCYSNIIVS